MANVNKIIIVGYVGKPPEMRYTPTGRAVVSFSVAVNNSYTSEGVKHEDTEWFNVVAWEKLAETINQYVVNGMSIYVEGQQKTRNWVDQQGVKHYRTELIARQVQFLSRAEKAEAGPDEEIPPDVEPEDMPF